eukprot:gene36352-biopygen3194
MGSNRIKLLIPNTAAWREEGHSKICKVSMDSYDNLYRECPGENLCRVRTLGTVALKEKWQELPSGKRTLAQLLLELYEEPDGYRVALGDLTRLQKQRLQTAYMGLERPSDSDADAAFLCQMRQLNHLREAIWEERRHLLDPSARRWSEELPNGSKWFVVYRGNACGVYADYDLAKSQIFQVPGGKLRGFPDKPAVGGADQLRLALENQRQRDRVHCGGHSTHQHLQTGPTPRQSPPCTSRLRLDRPSWQFPRRTTDSYAKEATFLCLTRMTSTTTAPRTKVTTLERSLQSGKP